MNMNTDTKPIIDHEAVAQLATYWLYKTQTSWDNKDANDSPASVAIDIFHLSYCATGAESVKHPESTFAAGFDLGLAVASAIAGDPLGNPLPAIEAALRKTEAYLANSSDYKVVPITGPKAKALRTA